MSNELVLNSEWTPFLIENRASITFDKFLDLIKQLDNNSSPNLWTKWKNYANQVVIETPNYYFKLYEDDYLCGSFWSLIRSTLGEIYTKYFNILWDVNIIKQNSKIYTLERRQKLNVCIPNSILYADLLLNWSNTLKKLENELLLSEICQQLKPYIPELAELKLIRNCINKYADYAITEDNNIVLLDDSDWFIAMVDKNGKWLNSKFKGYNIISSLGETVFAPEGYFDKGSSTKHEEFANKWQIYMENIKTTEIEGILFDQREQMLKDNISLIFNQKLLPNQNIKSFDSVGDLLKIGFE